MKSAIVLFCYLVLGVLLFGAVAASVFVGFWFGMASPIPALRLPTALLGGVTVFAGLMVNLHSVKRRLLGR